MKNKIKKFWKEHKEQIVMGGLAVSAFIFGYWYRSTHEGCICSDEHEDSDYREIPSGRNAQLIDEDIFTRIAPWIENSVLEEGLDETWFEDTYEVEYPKYGDPNKGMYKVKKKVEISVKDMTEE